MQKSMHVDPQGTGLPGLFLTIGLWIATCAMSIITSVDALIMLFVHVMQGLAFAGTLLAALCTASPTFKAKVESVVKHIFKRKK